MWRIMGSVFYGDKLRFWNEDLKSFKLNDIKDFLHQQGIALYDTAVKARRLKDNASDKFLDIVEPVDLGNFFTAQPTLAAVVTTGEKASSIVASMAGCAVPKIGLRSIAKSTDTNFCFSACRRHHGHTLWLLTKKSKPIAACLRLWVMMCKQNELNN